jgi:deazaflavin-dependent oxidoreductase (nitroreductase family)
MLLLHTRGARSGQPRSTPLPYTRHGSGDPAAAPQAAADHHPAWRRHLRAHPGAVTTAAGGRRLPVHPREAGSAERAGLRRLVHDSDDGYQVDQQRAGQRIIPVGLPEPA